MVSSERARVVLMHMAVASLDALRSEKPGSERSFSAAARDDRGSGCRTLLPGTACAAHH